MTIFMLFTDFNPPADPIPKGYKRLRKFTPAILAREPRGLFGDADVERRAARAGPHHRERAVDHSFFMGYDDIWSNIMLFRAFDLLALRFVGCQKQTFGATHSAFRPLRSNSALPVNQPASHRILDPFPQSESDELVGQQ